MILVAQKQVLKLYITAIERKTLYSLCVPHTAFPNATKATANTTTNEVHVTKAKGIKTSQKIGYMYYCDYAHLLKKCTEHACMFTIYYDQSSQIKADKCKMIVTFNTILESKILDTSNILILSNLQKLWMIVCKDVDRIFELKYSTYCKVRPHCASLSYPFHNMAAHMEATPTREGI